MIHLLSALIVGSVYSGGYSLRGRDLPIYKVSIILLLTLLGMSAGAFYFEVEIQTLLGGEYWRTIAYAREVLVYSVWLQSLICVALSIASFIVGRKWRHLAGGVLFAAIFLALAYATTNPVMANTLR
jgi:hypothetical protein